MNIVEGNLYTSTATFSVTVGGAAVDPTTVEFVYELNNAPGTKVTLTYVSATVPAPGIVARTGTGVYVVQVDTTGSSGFLTRYWQSTGTGQATCPPTAITIQPLGF